MFTFIEKKQEVKQEKIEYRTHITKYIEALNNALNDNSIDETFKCLLDLGTFLQQVFPGVDLVKLEEKIKEQSNKQLDPNVPLGMQSTLDPHLPLHIPLPNLKLIDDLNLAAQNYIAAKMTEGVAGVVTISMNQAMRIALQAYEIIMNDDDDRYHKALPSYNKKEHKADGKLENKFEEKIQAILADLIKMTHLEQFETEINYLSESFAQLKKSDEKQANALQAQLIYDLVRSGLAITMKDNELKVNIIPAISTWIAKHEFLALHVRDHYKQFGQPDSILIYFSILLLKIISDKSKNSQPEIAINVQAKLMEEKTIQAALGVIKRERAAVKMFLNFYVAQENSKDDYLKALRELCRTCNDCHPAFVITENDHNSFFDTELQLQKVSHRVLQHLGKTYSHLMKDIFNDFLTEIAKERIAIGTNEETFIKYQQKFMRVLRLLQTANQFGTAEALLKGHIDCGENGLLTPELKKAAFVKLINACNKRFNQGLVVSPRHDSQNLPRTSISSPR